MKISKKILAIVLAAIMIFSVMPLSAFAKEWTDEDVWGPEIQTGDILTSNVEHVHGLEEYTLTLPAGGYGDDFEVANSDLVTTEWHLEWFETEPDVGCLMIIDMNNYRRYYPYDANGMTNQWYVLDVNHEDRTIVLSGCVPSIPTVNTYTATWMNYNGAVLKTDEEIEEGTTPTYFGKMPAKPSTDTYFYAFSGWDPAVEPIAEDTTYTATFTKMEKTSEIDGCETFVTKSFEDTREFIGEHIRAKNSKVSANDLGWGANTNFRTTVEGRNGEKIVKLVLTRASAYGAAPVVYVNGTAVSGTLSGDVYTFDNLNATYVHIGTGSNVWFHCTDLVAYYKEANTYTVTWKNADGTVLETDTDVAEGTVPTYNSATPTKADDAQYTYTFAGWDKDVAAVTGDVTYTATYTATAKIQPVAEVNGTGYATLEEAIAAANAGDTVKLVDDIDFTETYAKRASHYLDISGLTIDLNGHTITTYTNGVLWFGNDATIKNGSFVGLSDDQNRDYAITIYGKEAGYLEQTETVASSNITLENLDVTGGISAWKAQNVVIKNCDVAANNYYAVWADVDNTTVVIESGSFTSNCVKTNGVIGAAYQDTNSTIAVKGGDFTVPAKKNIVLKSTTADQVNISGGTFNVVVPVKYCADGFVPVTEPNAQGKYEVTEAKNGYSLTIAEKIDVNFTISTDSYGAEGGTIVVNGVDAENESAVKSEKTFDINSLPTVTSGAYDGNVILSLEVAPAQLAEVFTLSVYDANGTFKGKVESSVYDYANAMKADAKYGELMKSLINYGALAKDYFNYDGAEITPAEGYHTDLTAAEQQELISRREAGLTAGNASFDGMVYFAKVEPEFKFYFADTRVGTAQLGGDSEGLSVNLTKTDNGVAAKVTGFKANEFGKTFTVMVDGTTLTINGYAYIASALKSESLKSLATGLFRYAQAAEAVA